jgi:3-hydroxyacyl-CoA dehydrogenase
MAQVVRYERRGSVGVITIESPPVNALSRAVRQGLVDALLQGLGDGQAKALVLIGAGRSFIAGADIREFAKPLEPPDLALVTSGFESSTKPTIAAITGSRPPPRSSASPRSNSASSPAAAGHSACPASSASDRRST